MAKKVVEQKSKLKKNLIVFYDYWNSKNYFLLFLGIIVLTLGYFLMSIGPWDNFLSLDVSPIVLLIAYLIIIPLAVLLNFKKPE
jgi:hypothetical protein